MNQNVFSNEYVFVQGLLNSYNLIKVATNNVKVLNILETLINLVSN